MDNVRRINLFGISVDALVRAQALDAACELARDHSRVGYVVSVNPEKVMAARRNPFVRDFINASDLAIPDGVGVVLAARSLCHATLERVTGADLMQEICRVSGERGIKIFLYGAKEEASAAAERALKERFPDVLVVGRENGYLPESQFDALVARVNASGADILFVALGSPRQEEWMCRYGAALNVGACMGIGGTLDAIAGTVPRAPLAWQKLNLEWLYRLIRQPSRIWRQRNVFKFGLLVILRRLSGRGAGSSVATEQETL